MASSSKNPNEIRKEIAEKQEAIRQFRFGGSGSKKRNVREGRTLRRSVARLLTELSLIQHDE